MAGSVYVPTIGIECHVQLKTRTKLFAAVSNDARDAEPNTKVSPICFGLPGVLPVLNEKAVELAIRAGLALNGEIAERMKFDRKHYFYPDLPKGYQITQYDEPVVGKGHVAFTRPDGTHFKVNIVRAHLEEDAGKSIHPPGTDYSLVDLNRAGTPLLEIVSAPDIHSAADAKLYARELYLLMKYADVSDVDLYHGNIRFDVNVSLAPKDAKKLGVRSEVKNLNSFRAVERAAAYEIKRQSELLEKGQPITQETRGWDEAKQKTVSQRGKEEAHDYRYFPEPDIPPVVIDAKQVTAIRKGMPKLPARIREDLKAVGLAAPAIETLLDHPTIAELLESIATTDKPAAQFAANLMINTWLAEPDSQHAPLFVTAGQFIELQKLSAAGQLSSTNAKQLFLALQQAGPDKAVHELAKEKDLIQLSDAGEIEELVEQAIRENPAAVADVKRGEAQAVGFLIGQVMKLSRGQANPGLVRDIIAKKLK
jgi:aspartyl-tRNA(Asn)/glutamyl-tRNA(Gln) amidotransferase subunit B